MMADEDEVIRHNPLTEPMELLMSCLVWEHDNSREGRSITGAPGINWRDLKMVKGFKPPKLSKERAKYTTPWNEVQSAIAGLQHAHSFIDSLEDERDELISMLKTITEAENGDDRVKAIIRAAVWLDRRERQEEGMYD
jgi:hypothetical protein